MNEDKRGKVIEELNAFLARHNVRLTAEDHFIGYAECGEDVRITLEFADYSVEDVDLGRYYDGK